MADELSFVICNSNKGNRGYWRNNTFLFMNLSENDQSIWPLETKFEPSIYKKKKNKMQTCENDSWMEI